MTATAFPTTVPVWLDIDAPLGTLLRQVAAVALQRLAYRLMNGGYKPADALDLGDAIAAIEGAVIAENTRRSYVGALRRFGKWLGGRATSDDLLAEYLGALHDAGKSCNSANQIVAAVERSARELRDCGRCVASPVGPATRRRLARYRRDTAGRAPRQAKGIGWEDADRMCEAAEADGGPRGTRDAALVGIASDAMLRVSEVSASDVEDVSFMDDGSGRARIRRSKTDQSGRGAVLYVGAPSAGRILRWKEQAGIQSGPLFRPAPRRRALGDRLGPDSVRAAIKRRAADVGIEGPVSGHSLRVGAAQSLAAGGASQVEMQLAGRWSSASMPARYARGLTADLGAVARLRHGARQKLEKSVAPAEKAVVGCG